MKENNSLMLSGHKLLYHLDELSKWRRKEEFPPINIEIGTTSACNHKCKHCYVDYLKPKPLILKKEVLFSLMKDLGTFGVKSICFAGRGEPLLCKDLPEAIEIAKEANLDIALATNGIFLTEEKAQQILKHLTWARFSILGGSPETYSLLQGAPKGDWEKLLGNLKNCIKIKRRDSLEVTLGIVMFIFHENGHEVLKTASLFKDIGVDYFVVKPVGDYKKNNYTADRRLKEKFHDLLVSCEDLSDDKFYCSVRWDMFNEWERKSYGECLSLPFMAVIDSDGGVYACGGYWQDKRYCYGNLNDNSFIDIWRSEKRRQVMEYMQKKINFLECYNCCRNHTINNFLWSLSNQPAHVNFI